MATDISLHPNTHVDNDAGSRFHLKHLMLWVTCCAAALALCRCVSWEMHAKGMDPWQNYFCFAGMALWLGTVMTGLILAIPRWFERRSLEPGHWLLVAQGIAFILTFPFLFGNLYGNNAYNFLRYETTLVPYLAGLSVVLFAACFLQTLTQHWKHVFRIWVGLVTVLLCLLLFNYYIPFADKNTLSGLQNCLRALLVLFWAPVFLAALRDHREKISYGWLHIMGLTSVLVFCTLIVVVQSG